MCYIFVTCHSHSHIIVVATTYHNDKWPHKIVNLLISDLEWKVHKRTQQGAFS